MNVNGNCKKLEKLAIKVDVYFIKVNVIKDLIFL